MFYPYKYYILYPYFTKNEKEKLYFLYKLLINKESRVGWERDRQG